MLVLLRFAITLLRADIPRLPEILASITPAQRSALQQGLVEHRRAFFWDEGPYWAADGPRQTPLGAGLAYNYTLASLQRTVLHLNTVSQLRDATLPKLEPSQ